MGKCYSDQFDLMSLSSEQRKFRQQISEIFSKFFLENFARGKFSSRKMKRFARDSAPDSILSIALKASVDGHLVAVGFFRFARFRNISRGGKPLHSRS